MIVLVLAVALLIAAGTLAIFGGGFLTIINRDSFGALRLLAWGGRYGPAGFLLAACVNGWYGLYGAVLFNVVFAGLWWLCAWGFLQLGRGKVVDAAEELLREER